MGGRAGFRDRPRDPPETRDRARNPGGPEVPPGRDPGDRRRGRRGPAALGGGRLLVPQARGARPRRRDPAGRPDRGRGRNHAGPGPGPRRTSSGRSSTARTWPAGRPSRTSRATGGSRGGCSSAGARSATCSASGATSGTSTSAWRSGATPTATAASTSAARTACSGPMAARNSIRRVMRPRSPWRGPSARPTGPGASSGSRRSRRGWSSPRTGLPWR